jgi:monoamine oxidase
MQQTVCILLRKQHNHNFTPSSHQAMNRPYNASRQARTPLMQRLQQALWFSRYAQSPKKPPLDELLEIHQLQQASRRKFIKQMALGSMGLAASSLLPGCKKKDGISPNVRIAIVGGGIAGLNAAYQLRKLGVRSTLYEATSRTAGRIYSVKDLMAPGLVTEIGAEFIDTIHEDMLALAQEFGLELLDVTVPSEAALGQTYYFNGQHYSLIQVIDEFRLIADTMQADIDKLPDSIDYHTTDAATIQLDNTSIKQYLQQIGAGSSMIGKLLDVAYLTEYGLDTEQQSSINMLYLINTDTSAGKFDVFGESDERFKVVGGNQQIPDNIRNKIADQISYGHQLTALRSKGEGYTLTFDTGGSTKDVDADIVVLALPFTLLREVDIQVALPDVKKKSIAELGYGTNTKLMLGFDERVWRAQGSAGYSFSDTQVQTGWDNSQLQTGNTGKGGYTIYSGGTLGVQVGNDTPLAQAQAHLNNMDALFPGAKNAFNGTAERMHWPSFRWTKGSYPCYKPGQFTSIGGAEIETIGNLFFAGDHCSFDYQGFMNGAAETGRMAAEGIYALLSK